ncbi:MAG: MAPEG family protein [Luteimonas sp.]
MPKITLLFASLHVLLLLALLARISRHRHQHRIGIGDGGDALLVRKIRVHGNFIENAPFALLLLALLELGGLAHAWLWVLGAALLLGRTMHAVGFSRSGGKSFGRFYGTALTWLALLAMALAGLWLALHAMA